eukprot:5715546-Amphidinium_carterae.1
MDANLLMTPARTRLMRVEPSCLPMWAQSKTLFCKVGTKASSTPGGTLQAHSHGGGVACPALVYRCTAWTPKRWILDYATLQKPRFR